MAYAQVLILSKGRPHCPTARALLDMDNPIDFKIVCGSDDETVPEYVRNFGSERVIVFDHDDWWSKCDMMDAYGRDRASGTSPVRNFMIHYARERGYTRCWQFDDDMDAFYLVSGGESVPADNGDEFGSRLDEIARLADEANLGVVGIPAWKTNAYDVVRMGREVCCLQCAPTTTELLYRARLFEDAVCMFDMLRTGRPEYEFRVLSAEPTSGVFHSGTAKKGHDGGLRDLYEETAENAEGDAARDSVHVRNVAYTTLALPGGCILRINRAKGTYRRKNADAKYRPMLISEAWERTA